MEARN